MADDQKPLADEAVARSQRQFGANAAHYLTSTPHAKGASLPRLAELLDPQPEWTALDIATGGGHVAFALAAQVASVIATDVTPEMLTTAARGAADRELSNIDFQIADSQALPFEDNSFDAVTCRIAPHHFSDPHRFVAEAQRVLRPGGVFGLVDNLAPEDPESAVWCDDFERRRDSSHMRCLPLTEWHTAIANAGLELTHSETMLKEMNFAEWATNMSVPTQTRSRLLADLAEAPSGAAEWLQPRLVPTDDGTTIDEARSAFHLTEGICLAVRPG